LPVIVEATLPDGAEAGECTEPQQASMVLATR
jgi:hypothetical protein